VGFWAVEGWRGMGRLPRGRPFPCSAMSWSCAKASMARKLMMPGFRHALRRGDVPIYARRLPDPVMAVIERLQGLAVPQPQHPGAS